MQAATWPAPAKLNLFLHVLGRRPDGLHELQTVFQFLDFGDTLEIAVRPDGRIRRLGEVAGVAPEADLVVRAARALQRATGARLGADIAVRKRIPLGGGLGGGSSDAATALRALDRLWGTDCGGARLAEIGLALGADVPVFVGARAAWAEGVGERLTPVELDEPWYLVVTPECHVPTAVVFGAPELTRNSPRLTIRDFTCGEQGRLSTADLLRRARNDCEWVARARYAPVDRMLRWLAAFGAARMTGTGASGFVPFGTREDALRALRSVPEPWSGFVARGCNVSPLMPALQSRR